MKRVLIAFVSISALLLVLALAPYVIGDMETLPLDDEVRSAMSDKRFVRLSDGVTHYRWDGSEAGPIVLLIHGFSTPSWVWEHQVPALTGAGFRVLRLDLFGRGLSDRPDRVYGPDLYDRQVLELLDALEIDSPIDIVGLSMGGAITVRFVAAHPERVRRFALIAPAGIGVAPPGPAKLLAAPLLGPWLLKAFGDRLLLGSIEQMLLVRPELAPRIREGYLAQMQYAGYKRALRSTLLNMPLQDLDDIFAQAGSQGKKSALFWGTADNVVPFSFHQRALDALPGTEFYRIDGAGHTVNFEQPEMMNAALVAFLSAPGPT